MCGDFYCFPATILVASTVQRSTTAWTNSWNAGFGIEFALTDPARFFIEARYVRLAPYGDNLGFVPVQIGLRF